MNQSAIAEAIEQDRPANLHTYTIYGHSDDIVNIEGPGLGNGLELYPSKASFSFLVKGESSIGRIIGQLVNDQWGFGVAPFSDGVPLPIGEYTLTAKGYTTTLTIRSMFLLTFEEDYSKARKEE